MPPQRHPRPTPPQLPPLYPISLPFQPVTTLSPLQPLPTTITPSPPQHPLTQSSPWIEGRVAILNPLHPNPTALASTTNSRVAPPQPLTYNKFYSGGLYLGDEDEIKGDEDEIVWVAIHNHSSTPNPTALPRIVMVVLKARRGWS